MLDQEVYGFDTAEGKDCLKKRIPDRNSIPRFISHNELAVGVGKRLSECKLSICCSHDLGLHDKWKNVSTGLVKTCSACLQIVDLLKRLTFKKFGLWTYIVQKPGWNEESSKADPLSPFEWHLS
jgi:hypothetical protein